MSDIMRPVATPYMKHLETLAISRLGERISALERVRSYWGGMIDKNATTFFEAFNENETSSDVAKFYDRPFGRSLCEQILFLQFLVFCSFGISNLAVDQ